MHLVYIYNMYKYEHTYKHINIQKYKQTHIHTHCMCFHMLVEIRIQLFLNTKKKKNKIKIKDMQRNDSKEYKSKEKIREAIEITKTYSSLNCQLAEKFFWVKTFTGYYNSKVPFLLPFQVFFFFLGFCLLKMF